MDRPVDINCDMGESFGPWKMGRDAEIMPFITAANIACGFHAGDPLVMAQTITLAQRHGVAVGAHPGYRDLHGFGRRPMDCSEEEVYGDVLYQLGAIDAFCRAQGVRLRHVKPHGALYNVAARDERTARGIVRAIRAFDPDLILYALPGGELAREGEKSGLRVAYEVFADRNYNPDGTLVSRRLGDAFVHDPEQAAERVLRMVTEGKVRAVDGTDVPVRADTVCIHGDGPMAVEIARAVRQRLEAAGLTVAPLGGGAGV